MPTDNAAMEAEPKRKRRWFQFSLRTLLIGVTLSCLPGGYLIYVRGVIAERRAELDRLVALNLKGELTLCMHGDVLLPLGIDPSTYEQASPSRIRRFLGDEPVAVIVFRKQPADAELRRLINIFPEAAIGAGAPNFAWLAGPVPGYEKAPTKP